ncbi:hypothetical protein OMAG_000250 [Candidatus Omnitrophus magneticus]|uniref:Uncharacterized protein n=1 Tax=Candidatus Omnitrophus magneticus TaxID=1609969 RepID=A0A0F0CWE5_9BACT|nr:hypothetical protein OMAG_000250 [Candidatus Omnitrophus magneticus]
MRLFLPQKRFRQKSRFFKHVRSAQKNKNFFHAARAPLPKFLFYKNFGRELQSN